MFQGFLSLINFGNNTKKMKRSFGKNVFSAVEITRSPIALSFPLHLSLLLPLQRGATPDLSSTRDTAGDWKYF